MANKKSQLALPGVTEQEHDGLRSWALVELYGHARIVGHVTADPIELPGTIRVDVPDLLKNAIYALTPCDEETVRKMLPMVDGAPARTYHLSDPDF